jgi:hypothetical protein
MSNQWLTDALENAQPFIGESDEDALIAKLLDVIASLELSGEEYSIALGAAFDLLVSAEYYGLVAHVGWLYCANPEPVLIYPYTNTCPRCILNNNFVFHKANKPKSGSIGSTTSRLLGRFLEVLLERKGTQIEILRGREPIDAIFVDRSTSPTTLFFAEIKASPLVTLPLAVKTQTMLSESDDTEGALLHRETDLSSLFGNTLYLFLPQTQTTAWDSELYQIGMKKDSQDTGWAYRGISALLDDIDFFRNYMSFWREIFVAYGVRDTTKSVYWLTNGCGQPVPRPDDWPRRSGTGYESISDAKTSVGMDRTDDIKKATYQVLKLGAEGKPSGDYNYKVGIVSNIHAVRHFDEYLNALKDIVWTREETGEATRVSDLEPDTELFNLFDGIVTLTSTVARDKWVKRVFRL